MSKYWIYIKLIAAGYGIGILNTGFLIGNPIEKGACTFLAVTVFGVLLAIELGECFIGKKYKNFKDKNKFTLTTKA